jgi:hypothetical protein
MKKSEQKETEQMNVIVASGHLPTNEEVDEIIEQDLPNSEEYKNYSEKEKQLMMKATKYGAKWFRAHLIKGNFR